MDTIDQRPARAPHALENVSRYRHPLAFYFLATAIPWAL